MRHPVLRRLLQVALLVVLSVLALPGAGAHPAWGGVVDGAVDLDAVVPPAGDVADPSVSDTGPRHPSSTRPATADRQPAGPAEPPSTGPAAPGALVGPGAAAPVPTDRPTPHAAGLPGTPDGRAPPTSGTSSCPCR